MYGLGYEMDCPGFISHQGQEIVSSTKGKTASRANTASYLKGTYFSSRDLNGRNVMLTIPPSSAEDKDQ